LIRAFACPIFQACADISPKRQAVFFYSQYDGGIRCRFYKTNKVAVSIDLMRPSKVPLSSALIRESQYVPVTE